jgi:hypothetical protein
LCSCSAPLLRLWVQYGNKRAYNAIAGFRFELTYLSGPLTHKALKLPMVLVFNCGAGLYATGTDHAQRL